METQISPPRAAVTDLTAYRKTRTSPRSESQTYRARAVAITSGSDNDSLTAELITYLSETDPLALLDYYSARVWEEIEFARQQRADEVARLDDAGTII